MARDARLSIRDASLSAFVFCLSFGLPGVGGAAELRVGGSTVDITPDRPVALSGQMETRISQKVEAPITATAIALESRQSETVVDQAIMISADIISVPQSLLTPVRQRVKERIPGFDVQKLFMNATHTHTAPVLEEGSYELPKDGIIRPAEYAEFLVGRLVDVAVKAWEGRKPGGVGWGLGHAVVAQNRRAVYADGRAVMYGNTTQRDFRGIEGYEDHGVEVLFFWDQDQHLIATAINVACTAQEVEARSTVNSDYWHDVRELLRARLGKDLLVLGWIGAAGDQSPHVMYRQAAEERMRKLRGLERTGELARRIVAAWDEAYDGARKEIHTDVPLIHKVATLELPVRRVTTQERDQAKEKVELYSKDPAKHGWMRWHQGTIDRYDRQQGGDLNPVVTEVHVIRLGDVAIATSQFELFTDYGIEMKARSRALQTFVIQLAGPAGYLPTTRAVQAGGYSAVIESGTVGPDAGEMLVEHTVDMINSLWP